MKTAAYTLVAICRFAERFHHSGLSAQTLFAKTGYRQLFRHITEEQICGYLRSSPYLVESWLIYSEDKRHTPSWAFLPASDLWEVCRLEIEGNRSVSIKFADMFEACARFVLLEMEQLREY